MNTPVNLVALAERTASFESSSFVGGKAAALIITVTEVAPDSELQVVLSDDATGLETYVFNDSPITRPGTYTMAFGPGLGLPHVDAQAGCDQVTSALVKSTLTAEATGGWSSIPAPTYPADYLALCYVSGSVTFSIDYVKAA